MASFFDTQQHEAVQGGARQSVGARAGAAALACRAGGTGPTRCLGAAGARPSQQCLENIKA